MNKYDVIVQAVDKLKKSEFNTTAIKVELEANLGRPRRNGWDNSCSCDDCRQVCGECGGDWEGGRCNDDCDSGYFRCEEECNDGYLENDSEGNPVRCPEYCDEGWVACEVCYEEGYYANCEWCDEGYVRGDGSEHENDFGNNQHCHEYIMERLAEYGLATYDENKTTTVGHDGYGTHWHPQYPLVYAEFYTDGSVDSEFTFTLDLNESKNVLLLPKFLEIFKEFGKEAGTQFDIGGAGMHMALINSTDCSYPYNNTVDSDWTKWSNFRRNMNLLMPALYLLGSPDGTSRRMGFRQPGVDRGGHRAAIDYRGGALEFRLFDTCYDRPETILDNVVVMSNAMKFWKLKFKPLYLEKITKRYLFGLDGGDTIDRLYQTIEHIELLNAGLKVLKPSYYTVGEVKQQRKFKKTKTHIKNAEIKRAKEAKIEYKEYSSRFDWSIRIHHTQRLDYLMQSHRDNTPVEQLIQEKPAEVVARLKKEAEKKTKEYAKTRLPLDKYVEKKINEFKNRQVGAYELTC